MNEAGTCRKYVVPKLQAAGSIFGMDALRRDALPRSDRERVRVEAAGPTEAPGERRAQWLRGGAPGVERLAWSSARMLEAERSRSEQLLLNVLPAPIAERLKSGERSIADSVEDVTVLFADSQAAGNNGSRSLQTISKSARAGSPVACKTAAAYAATCRP